MRIGSILFPVWEVLDILGPLGVLIRASRIHQQADGNNGITEPAEFVVVSEHGDIPTPSSVGSFAVWPDHSFDTCPQLDVLLVPGGMGTRTQVKNSQILDFVRRQARGARFVVSICTGSAILAESGVLEGKRATTNKMAWKSMIVFGKHVQWVPEARYVVDGNVVTASGVSAGVDMGIWLSEQLFGQAATQQTLAEIQYEPMAAGDDPFWRIHQQPLKDLASAEQPCIKRVILALVDGFELLDIAGIVQVIKYLALRGVSLDIIKLTADSPSLPINEHRIRGHYAFGGDSQASPGGRFSPIRAVCSRSLSMSEALADPARLFGDGLNEFGNI
ncbi:class I glutamine amidotransferase-like protein [Polychytrium aggregatum]|uniref:class I glutamine amidotransferase-like protein n=1 Tax=Polychytrium aggregatum TaxID=110093 RepID=UPI0022FDE466|nr:class I glutamine amidotransferase-like protein [Polychytrium aggregatum]KAI9206793.1 class I glutamine amidotransferase-like protein [Polychytrium aggregatum]